MYGKMLDLLLGVQWCVMIIFLFLRCYNFIKKIVHVYIVFLKKVKTTVCILNV